MPIARTPDAWFLTDFYVASVERKHPVANDYPEGAQWECFGYVEKGTGEFRLENKTYTVQPGDIIYIHKGTPYSSSWCGIPDVHFYSIGFSFRNAQLPYPLQAVHNCRDFEQDIRALYNTYSANKLAAMGLFYNLYEKLTGRLEAVAAFNSRTGHIEKALCHIRRNPEKHITVAELAEMCSLSEPHFYTLFKKYMGVTPIQHINRVKCKEVERLLMHTDMSIEEISDRLGFSSTAFMRRTLKKTIQKTPSEIRKEYRGM